MSHFSEFVMRKKVHNITIILLTLLLILTGFSFAHDHEHQAKGGYGSSEIYGEESDIKMHSEKHGEYKEHEDSSKHLEEGSSTRSNNN